MNLSMVHWPEICVHCTGNQFLWTIKRDRVFMTAIVFREYDKGGLCRLFYRYIGALNSSFSCISGGPPGIWWLCPWRARVPARQWNYLRILLGEDGPFGRLGQVCRKWWKDRLFQAPWDCPCCQCPLSLRNFMVPANKNQNSLQGTNCNRMYLL